MTLFDSFDLNEISEDYFGAESRHCKDNIIDFLAETKMSNHVYRFLQNRVNINAESGKCSTLITISNVNSLDKTSLIQNACYALSLLGYECSFSKSESKPDYHIKIRLTKNIRKE